MYVLYVKSNVNLDVSKRFLVWVNLFINTFVFTVINIKF